MPGRTEGPGLWVAFHKLVSYPKLLDRMVANGFKWLAVRSGDGGGRDGGWSRQKAVETAKACQEKGITLYTWHYSRPGRANQEVKHIQECLEDGASGHFMDAEAEWSGHQADAVRFGEKLRAVLPDAFIAHAPFGFGTLHGDWPYKEFAAFCDEVHPQMYWTECRYGKYDERFEKELDAWDEANNFRTGLLAKYLPGPVTYCPIGVTYGKDCPTLTGVAKKPPGSLSLSDLETFVRRYQHAPSWSLYTAECEEMGCLDFVGKLLKEP